MFLKLSLIIFVLISFAFGEPLKKVYFAGNKILSKDYLYTNLNIAIDKAWYDFSKDKTPKIGSIVIKPLEKTLINLYKSEGFYNIKVKTKSKKNDITFFIKEGAPIKIKSVEIKSNLSIKKFIKFKRGDRFIVSKFINSRKNIKKELHDRGYCNYDLTTKAYVDIKKYQVKLLYELQKNKKCFFGKIVINSPKNMPKKVIASRLSYKENDIYSPAKIDRSYKNILGLDAYDSVNIKESNFGDKIDTEISVTPKKATTVKNIGVGYETQYGFKALLHWEKKNFLGGAKKIAFDLKYSKDDKYLKNTFFYPALFKMKFWNKYFDFKNEFAYEDTVYDNFKEKKVVDIVHFQKDLYNYSIDFGIDFENIKITKDIDYYLINDGAFNLVSPFVKFIMDKRDSKIDPRQGYYLSSYLESGLTNLGSSSSYLKMLAEGRVIKTVNRFTIAFKTRFGLIEEFEKDLPESKLFFAGGSFSNRAYGYNKLGATNAQYSGLGGKTMIDSSLEIAHPIVGKVSFALFVDSTMLSVKEADFSSDFVNSYGFGIRYNTIIGPIKLDFGVNAKDSSIYAFHFQIGQSF